MHPLVDLAKQREAVLAIVLPSVLLDVPEAIAKRSGGKIEVEPCLLETFVALGIVPLEFHQAASALVTA